MPERTVLSSKLAGGPKGLGDPDDTFLRKVEKEVMIPKLVRDKARTEKCVPEVREFEKCCKSASLAMVYKCRSENSKMRDCLSFWYHDAGFRQICTEEYLKERSEFRRTGIGKKQKELEKQLYNQQPA